MATKQEEGCDKQSKEIPAYLNALVGGIDGLYHSKKFSDLTIKCEADDTEWKVHKAIVCTQSDALEKMILRGAQLEKKEDKDIITLDDDPQVIEAMLKWLYTWSYGDHGNRQEHVTPIVMDVRVFTIADKYFIKPLADLAATKFAQRCKSEWQTAPFAEAIKEVYSNSPSHDGRLKKTIIKTVKRNPVLFDNEDSDEFEAFQLVLREIADFGADASRALAARSTGGSSKTTYRCPSRCGNFEVGVPTPNNFSCPNGCYNEATTWWNQYIQQT